MSKTDGDSKRSGRLRTRKTLPDEWDAVAGAIIAVFLLATYWLVAGGGLYVDDIRAQAYAAGEPIWPFIVESNQTHLAPSARIVDWFQATYAPLEPAPAVVVTMVIASVLAVAVWICARWVIRHEPAALLGLFLALFSATIVPSLAWYRQALTGLAAFALVLVTAILVVRFVDGARWWWLAPMPIVHVIALGFSERALVAPILILAILALLHPAGARQALKWRGAIAIGLLGIVNISFLAVYLTGEFDKAEGARPTVGGFIASTAYSIFRNTMPALLGGPFRWGGDGIYGFARTPIALAAVASCVAALTLVAALRLRRGRALRLIVCALSFVIPVYLMVYVGRVARVSDITSVSDLRLHSDAAIVIALCMAGLLGVVVGDPRIREKVSTGVPRAVAITVASILMVTSMTGVWVSWVGFGDRWHENSSGDYVERLKVGLARNSGTVVPGPVPESIVPWWVQPDFSTERLVLLISPTTETSLVRPPVMAVDLSGDLVAARFTVLDTLPTPSGFCGAPIPAGTASVQIESPEPLPARRQQLVEVGLLVGDTTRIGVSFVDTAGVVHPASYYRPPTLHRGPGRVIATVPVNVSVRAVQVEALDANPSGVCVTSVSAGVSGATL